MEHGGLSASKIKYILKGISKSKREDYLIELIDHSEFVFEKHWRQAVKVPSYNLKIFLTPEIFTKNYTWKGSIQEALKKRINNSTQIIIEELVLLPDYKKLEIISSEVKPIYTPWHEINKDQNRLIEILQHSHDSLDFQNIGNVTRTIMLKLSSEIFKPEIHISSAGMDLSEGKFKNRLRTFIEVELHNKSDKILKKVAESSIDFVCNSIDLMNLTTHKINADKHLAELCVISAITTVRIIKTVYEKNEIK